GRGPAAAAGDRMPVPGCRCQDAGATMTGRDGQHQQRAGRRPPRMITIGQLASYAGVTVKAVRVYHARGLLPEPPRDASGYRRYTAEDPISLVTIRPPAP